MRPVTHGDIARLLTRCRCAWADYFEENNIAYAFFSAADAAAALEQAEKQRRRAEGDDYESESDEEDEDDEGNASGEEVYAEDDQTPEDKLSKAVESTKLDDEEVGEDEEGWSTEGEDETESAEDEVEAKLKAGERTPLADVAREVASKVEAEGQESRRTRVLTVTELEDLFISSAPDLSRESSRLSSEFSADWSRLCELARPLAFGADGRSRRLPERRQVIHHQRSARFQEGVRLVHARKDEALPDAAPIRLDHTVRLSRPGVPSVRKHASGHGRRRCAAHRPDARVLCSRRAAVSPHPEGDPRGDLRNPYRRQGR